MTKKLLTVREFDSIIGNEAYKDDPCYRYILPKGSEGLDGKKIFAEFAQFVKSHQPEDKLAGDNAALDFFSLSYRKGVGDVIKVKNYVGLVQLKSGFQIEILPKIYFPSENGGGKQDEGEDAEPDEAKKDEQAIASTKKIFLEMLRCLKKFPNKVFDRANLKIEKLSLLEIFIRMYVKEVSELAKRGLRASYLTMDDNKPYFKGKLIVNEHIKRNIAHKEKFYIAYDEFHVSRPENRLIKSCLLYLRRISSDYENVREIMQLLAFFELVEPSVNYEKDFAKVIIDRNTQEYKDIMEWTKVFLLNKSFSSFSGDTSALVLLFKMHELYEAYVARKMREVFGGEWTVDTQDKGEHLFDSVIEKTFPADTGANGEGTTTPKFGLRPDIVLRKSETSGSEGKASHILDTKWKTLNPNSSKNYGISQSDMYQMFAYAQKYKHQNDGKPPRIWLLYPLTEKMAEAGFSNKIITYTSTGQNGDNNSASSNGDAFRVEVRAVFLDLANIVDNDKEDQAGYKPGSLNWLKELIGPPAAKAE